MSDIAVNDLTGGVPPATRTDGKGKLAHTIADSAAIAQRYLIAYIRLPQLLVFSTVQPIMFVLLFRYVFGGAIPIPGIPYVDYLMPGIFVQTVVFGSTGTGIGLAEDAGKGLIERFRSLPMARSAVLIGRTWADLVRNILVVLLMTIVGFLVGWRIHGSFGAFILALVLIIIFGYSMSWLTALVGLKATNSEAAQAAIFPVLFPLTFASSAFVPVETMPGWLQTFATYNPVSVVVNAARSLTLGDLGTQLYPDGPGRYVLGSILWSIVIVAVFAPLAVKAYRAKSG